MLIVLSHDLGHVGQQAGSVVGLQPDRYRIGLLDLPFPFDFDHPGRLALAHDCLTVAQVDSDALPRVMNPMIGSPNRVAALPKRISRSLPLDPNSAWRAGLGGGRGRECQLGIVDTPSLERPAARLCPVAIAA